MRVPYWRELADGETREPANVGGSRGFWITPPSAGARWSPSAIRLDADLSDESNYGTDYHSPVMVREVLHYLAPERGGLYVDGTLGGGGHSQAILDAASNAQVIGVDRDPEARTEALGRLSHFGSRFRTVAANFAEVTEVAELRENSLAGVLLDLGISSHQIDIDERGFTFRRGAPLDMRMDSSASGETAADLLNELSEGELARLFYRWGEEKRSGRLARVLTSMRDERALATSDDLIEAIQQVIPRATPQDHARIFQALRMEVNAEIDSLRAALPRLRDALAPDGVLVVIAYHSVEDRVVKDAFREWSRECVCPPGLPICVCRGEALGTTLTRKPVMAAESEIETNPRSRSGRLRAWRKR